jgi:hypothetical protein
MSSALDLKKPPNRELLGGDLLAQSLHALGVQVAFGLHGCVLKNALLLKLLKLI